MLPIAPALLLAVLADSPGEPLRQDMTASAPARITLRPADLETAGLREARAGNRDSALRCARQLVHAL